MSFRPRVGMGWFMIVTSLIGVSAEFSSPSGDGLVLDYSYNQRDCKPYSSPLGDGLVQGMTTDNSHYGPIFVPEWGWVGSMRF